jgi:hypothetical protein
LGKLKKNFGKISIFIRKQYTMGKFIITEEDKKHIMGLYERLGDKLTPDRLSSLKGQDTKKVATFLNSYYKIKLNAATTGNWTDKDYNDAFKRFLEEKGIQVWVCKKGDGYCHEDDEGEVTTKELDKLKQAMTPQSNQQEKIKRTRNSYGCDLCGKEIPKGDMHGGSYSIGYSHYCLDCISHNEQSAAEIGKVFFKNKRKKTPTVNKSK